MEIAEPKVLEKDVFNSLITHPLQSWEWGEFREKTGIKVVRRISYSSSETQVESRSNRKKSSRQARTIKPSNAFQVTIHKIPHTAYTLGYLPKCTLPNQAMIAELQKIGKQHNCIFIKLEPNVEKDIGILGDYDSKNKKISPSILVSRYPNIVFSPHPLFTKYTFQLDLTKSEEELLKDMHPKTRYNIRVAQKHQVKVIEDNSDKAFEEYIRLMHQTTKRQQYYAHDEAYHRLMWDTLRISNFKFQISNSRLTAHLLVATYKGKPLVTWVLFVFNNVLYYPYGASSSEHKETMASNLIMWEAIRFGKKMGCKIFDMWGSLGSNPNPKDPWYGFHRFKQGYGAKLVEFIGSYDLVLNPLAYQLYNIAHRARWIYLRGKRMLR